MLNLKIKSAPTVDAINESWPQNLFIVGAGFSANAGLPLANRFTHDLLGVGGMTVGSPSRGMVDLIRDFVDVAFAHGKKSNADYWPELEDLFTIIDLSANSGHHLSSTYSPAHLRTVRRALIVRMIRMLTQKYNLAKHEDGDDWRRLSQFFSQVDVASSAFLSMNWDVVIEQGLEMAHGIQSFDYGCGATSSNFIGSELERVVSNVKSARVLKPHGSINWLYCDACRHVFWVPPSQTLKVADQLFRGRDWVTVKTLTGTGGRAAAAVHCPTCEADALGTRFATFSYRKALEFPMHARTWQAAEEVLYRAKNWIFIGYSLPPADYEFKHLLKRVELSRISPPVMVLITGGQRADVTRHNFQKFFGPKLGPRSKKVFRKGLDSQALAGLERLGCLSSV